MTTMQGEEESTPGADPRVYQPGDHASLNTYLWKGMPEKFLKGEPKVLGVMQILISLMNFSLGIIMITVTGKFGASYSGTPISVYSGYTIWGSVMFLISGSLSVAAGTRTTRGLVQGSLGVNITSSVFAASGIIITMISMIGLASSYYNWNPRAGLENYYKRIHISTGMEGIVLILSVLEFCIAVSLSVFGSNVTCCNRERVVFIPMTNPHMAETASPAPVRAHLIPPTD
ncbi:membrane-spanning 4-domains subfamily A member 4A-like [Equus quagga]|uniref:membrane-spanning 4-domains subfamily A member 4A-like n=1 Tax=Equus quagga TaxID=89248 RepID=UPI001EE386A3|nr:membrane-spanning 4-domains subfamily A member 4A-like [Equus quagga]